MAEGVQFRPVADRSVLVVFGDRIDPAIHAAVTALDRTISEAGLAGVTESVPAYASLLVQFDPFVTDHDRIIRDLRALLDHATAQSALPAEWVVEVCYDPEFAPDLPAVAQATGLTKAQVIAAHLAGDYSVFMYGFAPGYAYLAGVPEAIRQPRKPAPMRDVPAGSVLIAGPQCLVSTLTMPTGWWIIGRSPTPILDAGATDRPFLFDVGDRVRFRQISAAEYRRRIGDAT